jgi:hypothetical protein
MSPEWGRAPKIGVLADRNLAFRPTGELTSVLLSKARPTELSRSLPGWFILFASLALTPGLDAQVTLESTGPPVGIAQSDWFGIQEVYEAKRHLVLETESGS